MEIKNDIKTTLDDKVDVEMTVEELATIYAVFGDLNRRKIDEHILDSRLTSDVKDELTSRISANIFFDINDYLLEKGLAVDVYE